MYRFFISFFFVLLGCSAAFAQSDGRSADGAATPPKWFVGLRGGLNIGNVDVELPTIPLPDVESENGYLAGAFFEYRPLRFLAIQPEVNYWAQTLRLGGSRVVTGGQIGGIPIGDASFSVDADLKLAYWETALLAKAFFGKKVQFYVLSGPFYGWQQSAVMAGEVKGTVNGVDNVRTYNEEDVREDFRRTNYGISAGGGLMFPFSKGYFFVDGRANFGLVNAASEENSIFTEVRTTTASATLGVAFAIN